MANFWNTLQKPFSMLAPLEDVTDAAFRRLIASYAKPDVMYTEFTSADGLMLADEKGSKKLRRKLLFSEVERPIVAQLFTSSPERMEEAARLAAEMGFDGVDINMGCPDRAVEKSGCGAALIKEPLRARELIRAAKRGVAEHGLPVSVKTRIGYTENQLEEWLPALLAEEPACVVIHARTRKEMSDVPARWEHVAEAVLIRDKLGSSTLIGGNGDVRDMRDAKEKARETGCDGVMLGRAIFGNPWLFAGRTHAPTREERIRALVQHLGLFEELVADVMSYATMKKHFKAYISGWDGAKELRALLMETESAVDARNILESAV